MNSGIQGHPAYQYAERVLRHEVEAPRYVTIACAEFKAIADGQDKRYCLSTKKLDKIDKLLKLMIMPKGIAAGKTVYDATVGYQWLLYAATLCIVHRDNRKRRRYESVVLEIARKNFKTYTVAVIFILLLLTEPDFSRLFSVAPDGQLSREVKTAIVELIKSSPALYPPDLPEEIFKLRRDDITCKLNSNIFVPLNYSNSRLDGKLPSAFLVDEAGALPNNYAIEAMRSGQLTILNKIGFVISTKYPTANNPFETEVAAAKSVLDGVIEDETLFALLYEPDNPDAWATDERVMMQANPAAQEIPAIWDDLLHKRQLAIEFDQKRENFLTKHCNILYQGVGTESYIPVTELQACRVEKIEWSGREVFLGVDLSMTNDNCAVAMAGLDENEKIFAEVMCFIPEGRIDEKNAFEHVNYRDFIREGNCIACGDRTVDYAVIEDFVFDIEKKYGVTVLGIGYDRYNALSSAQKWERGRSDTEPGYNTVIIRQHSDTLHPPTKLLAEKIANKEFAYRPNRLLELNFENARCVYDTNLNRYVNKKRSNGKVDMVVALINAVYLIEQNLLGASYSFVIQM